ncbi:MAG: hypothetical protein SHS37scaffold220_63 [Phage 67_12]|nr:MAG: hypothetical protein SHS37scaffold220_63 [Phage 67_12]
MATGDQNDIQSRLRQLIPHGWFLNGLSPLRDALLLGLGNILAFGYSLLAYVRLQTRIGTATDGFLDMIAGDFFGSSLTRAANQTDASYRSRILINIFRERVTRRAVTSILTQLTGRAPGIFEPARPADTGSYGAAVAVSRAAMGAYYDAAGLLRMAAPNTPRYTYNPANLAAPTSLLVEAAATNLLTFSASIDNAAWAKTNLLTVVPGTFTAPDGTPTADAILENTTASTTHFCGRTFTIAANAPYAVSVFLKAAGRSSALISYGKSGSPFTRFRSLVNLTTGTVTGQDVNSPLALTQRSAIPLPNGWFQVLLGGIPDTGSTDGYLEIRLHNGATDTYTGDGVSGILVWGAQLEATALSTSYIPTGATTAARDPDVLVNNMPAGSGALGGYGVAGGYGSMLLPMQAFVTAYRAYGTGVPNVAGYGISTGAYSTPSQSDYVSITQVSGSLTDADIYAAIDSVRPVSYVIWARISS